MLHNHGMTTPQAVCASCGAPDDGELVLCRFCQHAISEDVLRRAIPCPSCGIKNRWGKQRCVGDGAWIVVSCVFCGALSPCNQPACLSCKEAFAGAAERRAARAEQQQQQELMSVAGMFAPAAGGLLGALAGSIASAGLASAYDGHYHPSWDASSGSYGTSGGDDPPIGFADSGGASGDIDTGGFSESGGDS
jgi:lactobin A/cerein 7B family class IIb bacteriocin